MHQNQWQAVIEELGGAKEQLPIPNSFPQTRENQEYSYVYLGFAQDGAEPPRGRWTEGQSIDGNGKFSLRPTEPEGREPDLGPARGARSAERADQGLMKPGRAAAVARPA